MNFISDDKSIKNSCYNSIGGNDDDSSKKLTIDQKSKEIKKNINNTPTPSDELNTSGSLSSALEKESTDRTAKLLRFGADYCRASPNIALRNKSMLNIGWRTQKYNYDVDYEMINYNGEKLTVIFSNT
jgi:hypothetical protein